MSTEPHDQRKPISSILTRYSIDGFDSGEILPIEIGPVINMEIEVMSHDGTCQSVGVCGDADTMVCLAKSILLVATELGVQLDGE